METYSKNNPQLQSIPLSLGSLSPPRSLGLSRVPIPPPPSTHLPIQVHPFSCSLGFSPVSLPNPAYLILLLFPCILHLFHLGSPPLDYCDYFRPPSEWDWSILTWAFLFISYALCNVSWIFCTSSLISTYHWVIRVLICLEVICAQAAWFKVEQRLWSPGDLMGGGFHLHGTRGFQSPPPGP